MKNKPEYYAAAAIILWALICPGVFAQEPPLENLPVQKSEMTGTWELKDTDGSIFLSVLKEDGTSLSNWGPGETGNWQIEGERVTVSWTDGWHDILVKTKNGFEKSGYAPGVPLTGDPTNYAQAGKLKEVDSNLVGRWVLNSGDRDLLAMTYYPDYTFGVDVGADGKNDITGIYQIEGDRINVKDVAGKFDEKCRGVSAVYKLNVTARELRYEQVEDTCPGRVTNFRRVWTRKESV